MRTSSFSLFLFLYRTLTHTEENRSGQRGCAALRRRSLAVFFLSLATPMAHDRKALLLFSVRLSPHPPLFLFLYRNGERPILISIMTRNGCWRECSSLSTGAPVPVVYLSGRGNRAISPRRKARGGRNGTEAVPRLLFLYPSRRVVSTARPPPLSRRTLTRAAISTAGRMPSRESLS